MTKVVHVQMTLDRANAVAKALDLSGRIMMGQMKEITNYVRFGEVPVKDDSASNGSRVATKDEVQAIESHIKAICDILGSTQGTVGIGSRNLPIDAKRQYEVQKAIQKVLADKRKPGGITVDHDGVTVRYTQDPEPIAQIREI